MLKRVFLLFLFLSVNHVFSQNCGLKSYKKKRIAKKIIKLIQNKDYKEAKVVISSLKEHPVFISYKSEIFWLEGDNKNAKKYANEVLYQCEDQFPVIYYVLSEISFQEKDFVSSYSFLKKSIEFGLEGTYLENAEIFLPKVKVLSEIISNPVDYDPKVITGISTEYDEYLPAVSPDQDFILFTRRYLKKGIDIITPSFQEEFIISTSRNNLFDEGIPLPSPFNIEDNEGGGSMSIDNKLLLFTKCSKVSGNYNNCDIFFSIKNIGKWGEIQSFNKKICPPYSWESQPSLSSDGKMIIFASDRDGGYGGVDLYEIRKNNFGEWSDPINLGPKINSANNEKSPFLHADGKTLFFASDNFPSLGGYDIFFSRKDSLGNWQNPQNIGYPINTSFNEISLFVTTDGKKAIFASNNLEGVGGWDLYSFDLHEAAKPERVFMLKGVVLDEKGQVINDLEIEIKNLKTKEIRKIKVENGNYATALTLATNDDVLITIKKEGYAFNSQYVSHKDTTYKSPAELDFELRDIVEGESFVLNSIYFDLDSYEINSVTEKIIIEFADYLKLNKSLMISINGYTDDIGEQNYNQKLSENRAFSVYNELISNGISSDRLEYKGFGESNPKNQNLSESERKLNRRTEFYVLKK